MGRTYKDSRGRVAPPSGGRVTRCRATAKVCFASETSALERAAEILRQNPRGADGFRAYHCPACGQFHITKQTAHPGIWRKHDRRRS